MKQRFLRVIPKCALANVSCLYPPSPTRRYQLKYGECIRVFIELTRRRYWVLNLWRPILPMQKPVQTSPLAFIDPATMEYSEFVKLDQTGQFPDGQRYLLVKQSPKHKWYYYPNMTTDEVLLWRQWHVARGEELSRMPVPHSAFQEPGAPKKCEARCSFEHRVGVLCSSREGQ